MSMIGRFVQVTPDELNQLMEDPSEVGELFAAETPTFSASRLSDAVRDRTAGMTPQALASLLERLDPRIRERFKARLETLGVSIEQLQRGEGMDQLMSVMGRSAAILGSTTKPKSASSTRSISTDKAWHGIHYLLCGSAEPGRAILSQAIMGGAEIGDDDHGYGPARYFAPDTVNQIAREMNSASLEAEMKSRFDSAAMVKARIYPMPGNWDPREFDWLMTEFRRLRDFFTDASGKGAAVLTCIV
jgi:uncharacterized protein DUF1877